MKAEYGARELRNDQGIAVGLVMTGVDGVSYRATHYDLHHKDGIYHQDGMGGWWKWNESAPGVFEFDAAPDGRWERANDMSGKRILPWDKTIDTVVPGSGGISIEMGYGK